MPKEWLWIPVRLQEARRLFIVGKLPYHGMRPAQGAVALPGGVYPVEFHRPGIECQQAVSQKLARAGQIF